MDQSPQEQIGHPHHHGRMSTASMLTIAVVAILVILVAAYFALTWHGVQTLSSSQTFSVKAGQSSYFRLKGADDIYSIYVKNTTGAYAVIYVSKTPVLTSPITVFSLVNGQSANISADGSSQDANLQVKLLSSTNATANIELIPIPNLFTISTSPGVVVRYPASFYSLTNTTPAAPVTTSNTSTGTQATNTTSTAANTTTTTNTTVTPPKPTTTALENISGILNTTYIGSLMKEYKALYISDTSCDSQTYGTDLQVYAHLSPVGPFDFANASAGTPTNLVANATQLNSTGYYVTYIVVTPGNSFPTPSVTFDFSSTSGVVTNLKFTGAYLDQNYTSLSNAYAFQNGIGGNCGAYIPYIP